MIKKCTYKKDKFEIEFEWPLSENVLNATGQIRYFIDKIKLLPGTVILKDKDNAINGLIFSYKGFIELLKPFYAKGREIQLDEEFRDFFSVVKKL